MAATRSITERSFDNSAQRWSQEYPIDEARLAALKTSPTLRMESSTRKGVTTLKFFNSIGRGEFLDVIVTITET